MRFWHTIDTFERQLTAVGAGLSLLAMILITVLSVIGRYWLQTDLIPGAYNMIERISFPLIVFWAVPYAHRKGTFPRFDALSNSLAPATRRWVQAFVLLVELLIHAVIMWYVMRYTWNSLMLGRTMQIGTQFWPIWPVLVMMPLALALLVLEMSRQVVCAFRGLPTEAHPQPEADVVNPIL